MKVKYKVTIEETVSQNFEIKADDIYEALEIAKQDYENGDIVLCPGELICKQISAYDGKDCHVDFYQF